MPAHEVPPPVVTRDGRAIGSLLCRHLGDLRAFVRTRTAQLVRDRESCSDITQSVCLDVLERGDRFDYRGDALFRAWLFKRARSKILDRVRYYRRQKRDVAREDRHVTRVDQRACAEASAARTNPIRLAMGHEARDLLQQALGELPEDQREALTLSRIAELPRAEVAARLGRSEESVRGLIERGLTRLSWLMTRSEPEAVGGERP